MLSSLLVLSFSLAAGFEAGGDVLQGTAPLGQGGDFAAEMVAGIGRFLDRELDASIECREAVWHRDTSSREAYEQSIEPNRHRLRTIIGAVEERVPTVMRSTEDVSIGTVVAEREAYTVYAVRWPALEGVEGEGLLLEPRGDAVANVVALPDCDWSPEQLAGLVPGVPAESQFARRLAENGCRVVVPVLIDRKDTYSGNPAVRMTNQPHREFVYRGAFEVGRHVIGYEVQKVLATVDWFQEKHPAAPVGVWGYGEGGLLALYSGAVDTRIDAVSVSGYFQPRESVWKEPIYRNVWALLHEFGDAEVASLIAPRPLVIEACRHPEISGPPAPSPGRAGAAPGSISTPTFDAVRQEVIRAQSLTDGLQPAATLRLVGTGNGSPGSEEALSAFLAALGRPGALSPLGAAPTPRPEPPAAGARMERQVAQLVEFTQRLMGESSFRRAEFWAKADASSVESWTETARWYRDYLWDEVIGRFPPASLPPNPRSRKVFDEPRYWGYEVQLDVYPEVFAYGILLVPKDLEAGERRPVVVCQHGLEGWPRKCADPSVQIPAYNQYGCKLAERGYVVFAPQNPYVGGDGFRVLQRKANPLKKSLFAVIVRQHERILGWLSDQPFVDGQRIALYGISYGGKTAMRVPALLEGYGLSICSADFNEWIWKNVSDRHAYSYLFTGEYEMFEFNLANTFNYAELSWLIFPRPFMVERGHHDGVAPDEWVAYEYARTRRRYALLGLPERTEIEYFNGPHAIHGVGTFAFLDRHLRWSPPESE